MTECIRCNGESNTKRITYVSKEVPRYHLNCNGCFKKYKGEYFCPECFTLEYILDKILDTGDDKL